MGAAVATASLVAATSCVRADTPLSGTVQGTLTAAGSPYNVSGRLTVPIGASLTIAAGVEMKFQDRAALVVQGTLEVSGTTVDPVLFNSATSTTPGAWCGIGVMEGASANLRHAIVRYAGIAGGFTVSGQLPKAAGLFVYRASIDVADSEISLSGGEGVYYLNDSQVSRTLAISDCLITSCASDGMHVDEINPADTISITGNTVANCGAFAFRVSPPALGRIAAGNTMSGNASGNGVAVTAGSTNGAVTLPPNGTWYILGQLTIPAGASLTVSEGDALRFRGGVKLQVDGTLSVLGAAYSPAALYADAAVPTAATRWAGIGFTEGSTGTLNHAVVGGAGYANAFQIPGVSGYRTTSICAYRADLSMVSVSILNGGGDGLYWYNNGAPHTLSVLNGDITTTENDGYVIAAETAGDTIAISGARVSGVQRYPILLPARRLADLSGNVLSGSATPAVAITGGTLDRDTALDVDGLYLALQPLTVAAGSTLTAGAGSTVRYASNAYLEVFGTFNSLGTVGKAVTLTSFFPNPLSGDWGGVGLEPGSSGNLSHTRIGYAGQEGAFLVAGVGSVQAGLLVNRAALSATSVTCDYGAGHGLYVYNASTPPRAVTVSGGQFSHNQMDGVHVHKTMPGDSVSLVNVVASANTGDGLRMMGLSAIPGVSGLTANGNGGFPLRTPASALGGLASPVFLGNAMGDQVALTGGSTAGDVTVTYPIRLLAMVDVPVGATLRFLPGADVTGESLAGLRVRGVLAAAGTPSAPINFHGPPAAASGAWGGIGILEGGSATLAGIRVDAAGEPNDFAIPLYSNVGAGILAYRANLNLSSAVILRSGGDGVLVINDGSLARTVTIASVAIESGLGTGVRVATSRADDALSLSLITVTGCGSSAISMPMRALYGFGSGCVFSGNAGGDGIRVVAPSAEAGTLARNATIPPSTLLFMSGTTSVAAGAILTLGAGSTVRMAASKALQVSGTLNADGTPERPVLFTADSPAPTPGFWGGIGFGPGSTAVLTGAEIRYAGAPFTVPGGTNASVGLAAVSANVVLNACLFRDCTGGVLLRGAALSFSAANCTFVDANTGVSPRFVDASGSGFAAFGGTLASGCDFLSTRDSAVVNSGPATVAARYCYWGAPDGPRPPGSGAGVSGAVDVTPFLTVPANAPVAVLSLPANPMRGVLPVTGTAYSPYFAAAVLEAGAGGQPVQFATVASFPSPVSDGSLGVWDTSSLADGVWTLRLTVTDRLGRSAVASATVTLSTGAAGSGDVNGNGGVDTGDAALALRMAGGLAFASASARAAGDVRPQPVTDGRIGMDDIVAILRKALNPSMPWP